MVFIALSVNGRGYMLTGELVDEMAQRIDDIEAAIKAGSDQTTSDSVGS